MADEQGVVLAPNVREMITQWLSVNPPPGERPTASSNKEAGVMASPPPMAEQQRAETKAGPAGGDDAAVRPGDGSKNWSSTSGGAAPQPAATLSPEVLRTALLRFLEGAPAGSDAAAGLGIMEGDAGARFLPLPFLGRAVGLSGQDFEVAQAVWHVVTEAPKGIFTLSDDARGAGLVEWAGWEEFQSALSVVARGTRDPAFEPRSIQGAIAAGARGAVRAGYVRQADVLKNLKDSLNPQDMPEDAAPALRSAISRRTRLALACLVDAIASFGLGPEAGPDSMGLVGQLPRSLFGLIFDKMDDRDRGACAFLGEILQSWDRRRCFSKRWLQDAASKFSMPKGTNPERDEGRGWYALTAENLHKRSVDDGKDQAREGVGMSDAMSEIPTRAVGLASSPQETKESRGQNSRSPRRRGSGGGGSSPTIARRSSPRRSSPRRSSPSRRSSPPRRNSPPRRSSPARRSSPPLRRSISAAAAAMADEEESHQVQPVGQPGEAVTAAATPAATPAEDPRAAVADGSAAVAKKKRRLMQDEEDDESVKRHLEESRKRRAALMAKYQSGDARD